MLGLALFLGTAMTARPMAWMLLVAAPFLAFSAYIVPSSAPLAVVAAGGGVGMGLVTALRQRTMVTVSSAMLGTLALMFSSGMLVYLMDHATFHGWFDQLTGRPIVLALILVLLIFIGTDMQLILGRSADEPGG